MAKILFIDGSILTTDKAFAPKDEQNIVIFTNATHAESGNIANLVLNIFGNKPGANKLATHNIVAFGDNINFGQPAPMLKAEPKAETKAETKAAPKTFYKINKAVEEEHSRIGYTESLAPREKWWNAMVNTEYFVPPLRIILSSRGKIQ